MDKTCVHCGCPITKGQLYRVCCGRYIHLTCLVKRHPRKLPQIIAVLKEKYGVDIARGFLFMVKAYFEEKPHLMKYLVEAERLLR